MPTYKYLITTISNRKGDIVELDNDQRTQHLLSIGAIELMQPIEPPVAKRTRKGGAKPKAATTNKVETK